jgi:POTRA domain, FtsQ-type
MTERNPEVPPPAEFEDTRPATSKQGRRDRGHVKLIRPPELSDIKERRRQRRVRKLLGQRPLPPTVTPRGISTWHIYISTRWFSALIVVALLLVLYLFLTRPIFFVDVMFIGGNKYLSAAELYDRTGAAKKHVFEIDPQAIVRALEEDPSIADATVELGWPPQILQISVTEREPAMIWEQASRRVWVDITGKVMEQRVDRPDLVRVTVMDPLKGLNWGPCPNQGTEEFLGRGDCIDPVTVAGALAFKKLYPNVQELIYTPGKGLGYRHGGGWMLWFGDGTDIVMKMAVNATIVKEVYEKAGRQLVEVNVTNPDAPVIRLAR